MANKYPFRLNGYIYSKGTSAGFSRMQRLGIPRPLFRIQDKLAKILEVLYKRMAREILKDIKNEVKKRNLTLDNSILTKDGIEDDPEELKEFFEKLHDEIDRSNMSGVISTLQEKWLNDEASFTEENAEKIKKAIAKPFLEEQKNYLVRLFSDADGKTQSVIRAFSFDKQKLFNNNMANLRELYLNNSIQRIKGEEDYIKRAVIQKIVDYATDKSETLEFNDVLGTAYKKGTKMADLFARDQMQRFNKAITLSTFVSAGVTKIKWVTCHDIRVRRTHKALDGKIFDINNLPEEIDDYNCRCGLVPVEWED